MSSTVAAQQLIQQYWQVCYRDHRAAKKLATAALASCSGAARAGEAIWAQMLFLVADAAQRPQAGQAAVFYALRVEFQLAGDAAGALLASALSALAHCRDGELPQALDLLQREVQPYLSTLDLAPRYMAIEAILRGAVAAADIETHLRFAYDALLLARQLDDPARIAPSLGCLAHAHLNYGNAEAALACLLEALALAECNQLTACGFALVPLKALALLALDRAGEAAVVLASWRDKAACVDMMQDEMTALGWCLSIYLAPDNPPLMRAADTWLELLHDAYTDLLGAMRQLCAPLLAWAEARWLRHKGDLPAALDVLLFAEAGSGRCPWLLIQVDLWHERYLVYAALENVEAALAAHIEFAARQLRWLEGANSLRLQTMAVQHALEAERISRAKAEKATSDKSAYIVNMSHAIRTPMNAVVGLGYLAAHAGLNLPQHNYVTEMQHASDALLELVDGTLDFSRGDGAPREIERALFDLDGVLTRLATTTRTKAAAKQVDYLFSLQPDIPRRLRGNALHLTQVLTNLLDNAMHYNSSGGEVELKVQCTRRDDVGVMLTFSVRDSGIGMDATQIACHFEPFIHADGSLRRSRQGHGMGLTIAQRLIATMGGQIGVQSRLGQGTTVHVELPFEWPHEDDEPDEGRAVPAFASLNGQRCLVVHPVPSARRALAGLFAAVPMQVDSAADRAAASGVLRMWASSTHAGWLFIDERLVDGDGLSWIQHCKILRPAMQIWMLSRPGMEALHERALAVGIDGILLQPLTLTSLAESLAARQRIEAGANDLDAVTNESLYRGQRILLAEDNRINQQIVIELLRLVGVTVDVASDGDEALHMLQAAPDEHYALILMDLQMPRMDGHAATRQLRRDSRYASLPVIALSAHAVGDVREQCRRDGMQDYLSKPIAPAQLYAMLQRWLNPSEELESETGLTSAMPDNTEVKVVPPDVAPLPASSTTITELAMITTPPTPAATPEDFDFGLLDQLDSAQGLLYMGGKKSLYLKLLERFRTGQADTVADIRKFIDLDAYGDAERLVHTLKGLAGSMGARQVQADASLLENALHNAQQPDADLSLLASLLANVERSLGTLLAQLNQHLPSFVAAAAAAPPSRHAVQAVVAKLTGLLAAYSGSSAAYFKSEQASLAQAYDAATLQQIAKHIETMSFDEARTLLQCNRLNSAG